MKIKAIRAIQYRCINEVYYNTTLDHLIQVINLNITPSASKCYICIAFKGEWGNWTPCSKSCDGGETTRQRSIAFAAAYGGTECTDDMKETQSCKSQNCPSTHTFAFTLIENHFNMSFLEKLLK